MKILHVVRPVSGGIKRHVKTLTNTLPEYEIKPIICGPYKFFKKEDFSCHYNLSINDGLSFGTDLKNIFDLRKIITKTQPDLIHAHGYKATLLTDSAVRFRKIPWVSTLHNFQTWGRNAKITQVGFNYLTRNVLNRARKIFCVSDALKHELINCGLNESKAKVLYNGIEFNNYHYPLHKSQTIIENDKNYVACVARLAPDKGVKNFLMTVKYLLNNYQSFVDWNNLHFIIVGDGPDRKKYEQFAWDIKISPYVTFLGYRNDVPEILKSSKALCIPSKYEGLSITAIESMASLCPVIATNAGGLKEVVLDGSTGLIASTDDPKDMGNKLVLLLKSKKLRRKLIFKAYKRALDKFSDKKMVRETVNFYKEVGGKNVL
ncbi:glycosyltransferase family 4 protein [Natranaerobius trueperi]|uniref:Glycosyl transferase family 1 n=1 Tax=Natranaerobius trueperi TaxID=759412 RepID=A0A226C0T6_9FIRM|nr:glycosyltransferase family 4 protein [Natranaerobius trueperi]OWZ84795.1 hypothetical protein CDO51_01905 [Natranaerobius trueperi]